jgi:hypothetical protein
MATTTHTATSKPTGPPMTDAPQALRAMTEAGTAQAKEAYGKVSAATAESDRPHQKKLFDGCRGRPSLQRQAPCICSSQFESSLRLFPQAARREVAFRVHAAIERTCTEAIRDSDRPDQRTGGARSAGHACDHGAAQNRRHQGIYPRRLKLLPMFALLKPRSSRQGFSICFE